MPFNRRGRKHNEEGPEARSTKHEARSTKHEARSTKHIGGLYTLCTARAPACVRTTCTFFVLRALRYRDKVSIETGPYPLKRSKKRGLLFSPFSISRSVSRFDYSLSIARSIFITSTLACAWETRSPRRLFANCSRSSDKVNPASACAVL